MGNVASIKPRIEIRGNEEVALDAQAVHDASIKPRIEIRGNEEVALDAQAVHDASIKPRIEIRGNKLLPVWRANMPSLLQ